MTKNELAYTVLVELTAETRFPTRYHTDLYVIAASQLGTYPANESWRFPEGIPFGYVLREFGVDLEAASININNCDIRYYERETENRNNRITHAQQNPITYAMHTDETGEQNRYFWWDGESLMQVPSPLTVIDRMKAYQEFSKENS